MSTTNPTVNGVQALWGMDGTLFTGILTGYDDNSDSDEGEILDNNGYRITDITFNQKSEYTLTILIQAGTTLPVVGAMVTIGAVANCIVKSVGRTYGQKDWRKFKMMAKNFVNLVPAS
jgi:hypothetical protein